MTSQDESELRVQVERLQGQVEFLTERLLAMEQYMRVRYEPPTPTAPVVTPPPAPRPQPVAATPTQIPKPVAPVLPPTPRPVAVKESSPPSAVATEYMLGARLLPKVGAMAVVLGLAFFVSLAVNRGWLTPTALFCLGLVASFGFCGYGLIRYNEKEGFGQILVAIGLSGFYVDFAAGYAFQHLYGAQTAVMLYAVTSFVSLGLGCWRSSRAFALLGLGGGVIAAAMPLQDGDVVSSLVLAALVFGSNYGVAVWRKWSVNLLITLAVSACFIVRLATVDTEAVFAAILGLGVMAAWASAAFLKPLQFDEYRLTTGVVASAATVGACYAGQLAASGTGIRVNHGPWFSAPHALLISILAALAACALAVFWTRKSEKFGYITGVWAGAGLVVPGMLGGERIALFQLIAVVSWWILAERTKTQRAALLIAIGVMLMAGTQFINQQTPDVSREYLLRSCFFAIPAWLLAIRTWWITVPGRRSISLATGAGMVGAFVLDAVYLATDDKLATKGDVLMVTCAILAVALAGLARIPAARRLSWPSLAYALAAGMMSLVTAGEHNAIGIGAVVFAFLACLLPADELGAGLPNSLGWAARKVCLWFLTMGLVSRVLPSAEEGGLSTTTGSLVYSIVTVGYASFGGSIWSRLRRKSVVIVNSILLLYGLLVAGNYQATTGFDPPGVKLAVGLLIVLSALLTYAISALKPAYNYVTLAAGSLLTGLLVVDQVYLAGFQVGSSGQYPLVLTTGLIALALGLAARIFRRPEFTPTAIIFGLLTTATLYWGIGEDRSSPGLLIICLCLALVAMLFPSPVIDSKPERVGIYLARGLGGWLVFSQLTVTVLGQLGLQWSHNPCVSIGWTLYAIGVIVVGFHQQLSAMRMAGVGLLLFTAVKVVLVDLATTDPVIKVLVLTALGVTMLVVGNYYVRKGNGATPTPVA